LFSVGALNPNRSRAVFSDGGHWINAWASGAAVVSTFPVDVNGSRSPEIKLRGRRVGEREALDPDDYSGGFAVWSGTSFSAPLLAAHIARALADGAANKARRLDSLGQAAATKRAVAALTDLGWRE
jgi:subtilisin family serine protease